MEKEEARVRAIEEQIYKLEEERESLGYRISELEDEQILLRNLINELEAERNKIWEAAKKSEESTPM